MLQPPPEKRERRSSTLGQWVVVLLVIALFAALVIPAMRRARGGAQMAQCLSNLKQLGLALHMYSQDYGKRFPTSGAPRGEGGVASLELLYGEYVTDPRLFICPGDETVTRWDGKGRLGPAHCSYGYDHAHVSIDPADVALAADCKGIEESADGMPTCHYRPLVAMGHRPPPNSVSVLFIDGHVKSSIKRTCGHEDDDIFAKSETLPPGEDSWITQ